MEVIIRPDRESAERLIAEIVEQAVSQRPALVLGLATGQTMEPLYERLVEMYEHGRIDFAGVTTFNLDEYVGLPENSPQSYRSYMNMRLFEHVNIPEGQTHLPNGNAEDLDEECRRYEHLIKTCGGIDLQVLGIGRVGHIGFNEPLSALRSRTRVKALTLATVEQNAADFDGDVSKVPRHAITMGVGTILDCDRCVLLATGKDKATIVAEAVEGPVTSMISASALQLHPKCTVVVDEAAGGKLQNQEYYRWIFENEPEWVPFR